MFSLCRIWTVLLLLGFCFTDGGWGILPAQTLIDCKTPMPFDYGSINEGYSGTLETIQIPAGVNSIGIITPSCPVCIYFLNLALESEFVTVYTNKPLDAEALAEYDQTFSYSVVCVDSRVENSRTLKLTDINDNAPVFEKDMYEVAVSETLPVGSLVVQVKATDADLSPAYNTITYSMEPPSDTFEVTSNGSILLQKQLNHAITSVYTFNVTAKDIDYLSGTTEVQVTVTGGGGGNGGPNLAPALGLGLTIPVMLILTV